MSTLCNYPDEIYNCPDGYVSWRADLKESSDCGPVFGIYADPGFLFFTRKGISTVVINWAWLLENSLVGLVLASLYGFWDSALENRSPLCVQSSSTSSADDEKRQLGRMVRNTSIIDLAIRNFSDARFFAGLYIDLGIREIKEL